MLSSSSSSGIAAELTLYAFNKTCAPSNVAIGPYVLVDDCDFPDPPSPINLPDDPPIPIPPIDSGCYPITINPLMYLPGGITSVDGFRGFITYPTGDYCEPDLNLELELPCFINAAATASADPNNCTARAPSMDVTVEKDDTDGCDLNFKFNMNIPCPIWFRQPILRIHKHFDQIGEPWGKFEINPDMSSSSSSTCSEDCFPRFVLDLHFPCPVNFQTRENVGINFSTELGDYRPWALEPTANFVADFPSSSELDRCSPTFRLELNLPCPVSVQSDSTPAEANQFDSYFYSALPAALDIPERNWAFGQPTGYISVTKGVNADGIATPCVPELELNLNLPCPAGGKHRAVDLTNPFELALLTERVARYQSDFPGYYNYHPYYTQLPDADVRINQNLDFFRDTANWGDSYGPSWAHGNFDRMEFDANCNLDLGLSMFIPCGARSPIVEFYDIGQYDNPTPTPLNSADYNARVIQDWENGEFAGDCVFNETLQLFLKTLNVDSLQIVEVTNDGGVAGSVKQQCTFTYTLARRTDQQVLATGKLPKLRRTAAGRYEAARDGTWGIALYEAGEYTLLIALDERQYYPAPCNPCG